jgi:hypothetical protein
MNLVEIRQKFREISGRYDLVNDDFSDNGADFFINEGSRWLDKAVETTKSWASYMEIINAGDWYVQFSQSRAIKEVWISTIEGKWQLEKIRLQDLIASFFTANPSNWINGTPVYYSPILTRTIPETLDPLDIAAFSAFVGLIQVTSHDYNAIILSSPVDQDTLVEVIGLFYSQTMSDDTDTNFWATVHPLLLIQAAIRQTYIVSGNKPMLDIIDRGLDGDLTRLGYDLTEQIIAEIDQMEG